MPRRARALLDRIRSPFEQTRFKLPGAIDAYSCPETTSRIPLLRALLACTPDASARSAMNRRLPRRPDHQTPCPTRRPFPSALRPLPRPSRNRPVLVLSGPGGTPRDVVMFSAGCAPRGHPGRQSSAHSNLPMHMATHSASRTPPTRHRFTLYLIARRNPAPPFIPKRNPSTQLPRSGTESPAFGTHIDTNILREPRPSTRYPGTKSHRPRSSSTRAGGCY